MDATDRQESPEELAQLRSEVRTFVEQWRADGRFSPRPDAWLRGYDREFSRALGQRGWIGITWPRHLGGQERSNLARLVVTEEFLRVGAPVGAHWIADRQIGPAILAYGEPRLQEEILPQIAAGEATFCLGMSETEAGSDLAAVQTRAVRVDGGWRITGTKIWTSQAHRSEYAYVLARTDEHAEKDRALTEFVVDLRDPAVTVRPILDLQGEHHFNELLLDGVITPEHYVIGEVGNGWSQVTRQLAFERGGPERVLSTYPLLEAMIEQVARQPDDSNTALLGELIGRAMALRRVVGDIAREMDAGGAPVGQAAMLKQLGTAFEQDVAEQARHVIGVPTPPGPDAAGILGDALLAGPGFSIRGGTSEVLLSIIARSELAR